MTKRVKIFEAGNHGFKGNFPVSRVKEIFDGVENPVMGQFQHTSNIKGAGKEALELAEFSNFGISEEGVVEADVTFNEKGEQYYNDGIINGVSVEISENGIDKVAILPIGVQPAISGAEFSEEGKMTIGGEIEVKEFAVPQWALVEALDGLDPIENRAEFSVLRDLVFNKMDIQDLVDRLGNLGYHVNPSGDRDGIPDKTEFSKEEVAEQVRKELEMEYKAKEEAHVEFSKLEGEGKITKAMKEAGLTVEFMAEMRLEQLKASEGTIEFGAGNTAYDTMSKIMNAIPARKMESELKGTEFSADDDRMATVRETMELMYPKK